MIVSKTCDGATETNGYGIMSVINVKVHVSKTRGRYRKKIKHGYQVVILSEKQERKNHIDHKTTFGRTYKI